MRMEFLDGETISRAIGAAVVRPDPSGVLLVEFGPADGPAQTRLRLTVGEVNQLVSALKAVANGREEEIIMGED